MKPTHRELKAILRTNLNTFIGRAFMEVHPNTEFLESRLVAAKLQACAEGKCKRLIITAPPRSLKSFCVSVAFPAWQLGRDPSTQFICASYGQGLAENLARDSRTIMLSPFYKDLYPNTRLSAKRLAVNDFATDVHGGRMSTSVGGVLTGRGADILILDDPLKPDEALSETRRNAVNEWYTNTLLSRLNSKKDGVIIIVMQRLHTDDLVGHVSALSDWEILSLPAIAQEEEHYVFPGLWGPEVFSRKVGDLLEPKRDTHQMLAGIRSQIGEYNFFAQYLQNPQPASGFVIKREWIKFYDPLGFVDRSYILQSWDTANKSGELNDYSVCTTWAVNGKQLSLLHVFREKLDYPDLKKAIVAHMQRHKAHRVLIENRGSGIQLCQDLKRDGHLQVRPYDPPPGADKYMRLHIQSAQFEAGNVFLPTRAPWLETYLKELLGFPASQHDDQVDSTTQALDFAKVFRPDTWTRFGAGPSFRY